MGAIPTWYFSIQSKCMTTFTGLPFTANKEQQESLDNIPWNVQCELVQELLDKLKDPRQSTFQKGKAALQLSSYYAVGLGCKRNYNEVLRYFRLSATLGDSVAQIVCPRVFVTHGEPMDRFEMEDIPQSESPADPDLLSTED